MSENLEILTETMVDTIPQPDDSDYPQLSDVGEEPSLINEDPLDRTTESQDDYGEPNDDYEQLELPESLRPTTDNPLYYRGEDTYFIVSMTAYLLGVDEWVFDSDKEPMQRPIFDEMEKNKSARIIRNLCRLRTQIELKYKALRERGYATMAGIEAMDDLIDVSTIRNLRNDGVPIHFVNGKLTEYLIDINQLVQDRINNVKSLFPLWLNWHYYRRLFIMPNGNTIQGLKDASTLYYANKKNYPYKAWLNWNPEAKGNILAYDRKFLKILYSQNRDRFDDVAQVSKVSVETLANVDEFLSDCRGVAMIVDCENADPYKLASAIKSMEDEQREKITSILLFDDVHAANVWQDYERYVSIPVRHLMIERIKEDKSLVDIRLTAAVCELYFANNIDHFILVSSDSDFYGLVSALPNAKFLVMLEYEKSGPDIKIALDKLGVGFCYLDDFYSQYGERVRMGMLFTELEKYLQSHVDVNIHKMLSTVLRENRVDMDYGSKIQFIEKYLDTIECVIDEEGNVRLHLGNR